MKRLLLALIVGSIAIVPEVSAQIAAAIGKPLPSPDLAVGTVSVRIVAGSPASPVIGSDVTLTVNGATRVARTDSAGRAIFKDLPPGAQVQAKVVDDDKKDVTSEDFTLPAEGGVRLMLTTKPWNPGAGAGGAPFAGGAGGGPPEPRQMSGEPRLEQADAPGTYTVRLTYDDFKDVPPIGIPVTLVGYSSDDKVTAQTIATDKDGRSQFTDLDRTGATAYFAMAQLPRGNGIDRLISTPAVLDARVGVRLVLSADKRTSTEPPIDDIVRLEKQESPTDAGKIRVTLDGVPEASAQVALVDAATAQVIAKGVPVLAPPDPNDVRASAQPKPMPDAPAGTLEIQIHGGAAGTNEPIPDIDVLVIPATAKEIGHGITARTAKDGWVKMDVPKDALQKAVLTINGKQLISNPFDVSKAGVALDVGVEWDTKGKPQIIFDAPAGKTVYAEARMRNNLYRTIPFQPVDGHGTRITMFVYPRVMFTFSLTSHIDDAFLAVSGRFDVSNNSWAPYVAGPDGLVIPLPHAFKGAIVAEQDQGDVSVAAGEGYRIVRPIPPGGKQFHGAFSLPVERGAVEWLLDLPLGAFQSGLEILQVEGMHVDLPPNVKGQWMTIPQGTFFVLPQISILPKQAMKLTITGLPSAPAWRLWGPRLVGILAVMMMLSGLAFALLRTRSVHVADAEREARRSKLLDELVELERTGKDDKRREDVMAELEQLWDYGGRQPTS